MSVKQKRILIADATDELIHSLRQTELSEFELAHAKNGEEAVAYLSSFHPHLVIVELMLPGMDGIEFLRRIRAVANSSEIGVILTSYDPMIQAYRAAINLGANYFLIRSGQELSQLSNLCHRFFTNHLQPGPFPLHSPPDKKGIEHCYVPRVHTPDHYIRFWGTRGSCPVAGSEYLRYGGNSSCLEIRTGDKLIIIDAGSGIRSLGETLVHEGIHDIHLFLSHTHWDHIIGFPFFAPLYDPNVHISIWAPVGYEKGTRELFEEMLAYAFFPMHLEDTQAKITFHELRDGQREKIGLFSIDTHYAYHPGATLCFKITLGKVSIGYVTDNEVLMGYHGHPDAIQIQDPLLNPHRSLIRFFQNIDILIHEAQYDSFEYLHKEGWGHSSISNASVLVKHCKPHEWIVTHHDPIHTDEQLQKKLEIHHTILDDCHVGCEVQMAYDGLILPIDSPL